MKEYILKEDITNLISEIMSDCKISHKHRALNRKLKQMPTADVARIVKCQKCIYRDEHDISSDLPEEIIYCTKLCTFVHKQHFCSYAEEDLRHEQV